MPATRLLPDWKAVALIVLATLLLLLVWQGMFWASVHSAERAALPASTDDRTYVEYIFLDESGNAADGAVHRANLDAPAGYDVLETSDAPNLRFLIPFEVADPSEPLALFLEIRNFVTEVQINGAIMQPLAPLPKLKGLVTAEPGYYPIPVAGLKPGQNLLTIDAPTPMAARLSYFAIGPADALASNYRWKNFLQTDLALAGVAILAFTVLLCLVVRWPREDWPRIASLVSLLIACAANTYILTLGSPIPLFLQGTVLVFTTLDFAIAASIAAYMLLDLRAPIGWVRSIRWIIAAIPIIVLSSWAGMTWIGPADEWLRGILHSGFWSVIVIGAVAVCMLAFGLVRDRGARWFERSILAFCISAFVMDRVGTMFHLHSPFDPALTLTLSWTPIVGSLLGLSLVVALAREAAEARRTVVSANDLLKARLAEREAALKESYAKQQHAQRVSVLLEERQRIVRDMHDGIGGQLLGLMLQVRARQLDPGGVEAALESSISDLRLIVDSLDSAEDSLAEALVSFEYRVRAQIEAACCRLDFRVELDPDAAGYGPRTTLQILRILQEAVTNSLRHARPKQIRIAARFLHATGIEISVVDDGDGFSGQPTGGRGLSNMRARAVSIGATLDVISGPSGTSVRVCMPNPVARALSGDETPQVA